MSLSVAVRYALIVFLVLYAVRTAFFLIEVLR